MLIPVIALALFIAFRPTAVAVETVWGPAYVTEPLLKDLLQSKAMQRIKGIDQSGPLVYFNSAPAFSRYDHCVGVMAILQHAGAPLNEQAAGLLHDASHTVFSHVGDNLFYKDNQDKSYQDTIHLWFLEKMEINPVIQKYGITLSSLDPDLEQYTALERHLPDLCADRIQYIIHTGVIFNKITKEDAQGIVKSLSFKNDQWLFSDKARAKQFADLSLAFTTELWGSAWNCAFYDYFSKALQRALDLNLVSRDELHFSIDTNIMEKLRATDDLFIQTMLRYCSDIHNSFSTVEYGTGTVNITPKFRGVDPLIQENGTITRLTELDADYKNNFEATKLWCKTGYGVVLLPATLPPTQA